MFHSVRGAARLARPAAPAGAAAAPWPRFSRNVRLFSAFRDEWRRVRESVESPPSDDAECELFREQAVDQATARRLANFFSMEQVWDFMEAVYGKPGHVLARIEREVRDHRMVPRGDREAARRRRADLSAMTTQAALHGVKGLWASTDNFNICLGKLEEECRRAWDARWRQRPPADAPAEFFRWIEDGWEEARRVETRPEPPDRRVGRVTSAGTPPAGRPHVAAAAAEATGPPEMVPGRKCKVSWCEEVHGLADCPQFLGFSRARRYLACMRHSVCSGCLSPDHWDLPEKPACRLGGAACGRCKDWHHELLMCPESAPKSSAELEVWERTGKVSVNAVNGDGPPNPVQMLAQRIGVGDSGVELNAF